MHRLLGICRNVPRPYFHTLRDILVPIRSPLLCDFRDYLFEQMWCDIGLKTYEVYLLCDEILEQRGFLVNSSNSSLMEQCRSKIITLCGYLTYDMITNIMCRPPLILDEFRDCFTELMNSIIGNIQVVPPFPVPRSMGNKG